MGIQKRNYKNKLKASVLKKKAKFCLNKGKLRKALEILHELLDHNPTEKGIHLAIAEFHFDNGELDKAIFHFKKELSLNPDDPYALSKLGIALSHFGEHSEAIESCRKAIVRMDDEPDLYYNLGRVYSKIDNNQQAYNYYLKAAELGHPNAEYFIQNFNIRSDKAV